MAYIFAILVALLVLLAILAVRAKRLISSAIFLAGVSALLSVVFYLLGAQFVAVIELSVGAGLVTVLFVYAINIAGDAISGLHPVVNKWLAVTLIIITTAMLALFLLPTISPTAQAVEPELADVIWEQRAMDVLVQIVLIFSGVLGLLGLLAEAKAPLKYPVAEQVAAKRQQEMEELYMPNPGEEAL